MHRNRIIAAVLIAAGCAATVHAQTAPADDAPESIIEARRALMSEMERLMLPIDLLTVGESVDNADPRSNATSIAQMLKAFVHLFPPATNLYDAAADMPVTLALPSVWDEPATFTAMSASAVAVAEELTAAEGNDATTSAAARLRSACDACHAVFLLPYTPPSVSSEDVDFDFDALFEDIEAE